jgi:hypothetical protein
MSVWGLEILDSTGKSAMITINNGILLSAGTTSLSNSLNGDGTYGIEITLPTKTGDYSVNNLAVIVQPAYFNYGIVSGCYDWSGSYPFHWYMDSTYPYYQKNNTTGVMSGWTAGSMIAGDATSWDAVQTVFPLGGWDYADGITTVSKVRLWAATTYIVYDQSTGAFISVYSIGSYGVPSIHYAIYSKDI